MPAHARFWPGVGLGETHDGLCVIRLQSIYNLLFFSAIIFSVLDVYMDLYAILYHFFRTSILTQCLVPVVVFCLFLLFQQISTKRSPNATELFDNFFWTRETLEVSGGDQKANHYKFSKIGKPTESHPKHFFHRRNFLFFRDLIWGLFGYSVGERIDHGGLLHHPCCPPMMCGYFTTALRVHC